MSSDSTLRWLYYTFTAIVVCNLSSCNLASERSVRDLAKKIDEQGTSATTQEKKLSDLVQTNQRLAEQVSELSKKIENLSQLQNVQHIRRQAITEEALPPRAERNSRRPYTPGHP